MAEHFNLPDSGLSNPDTNDGWTALTHFSSAEETAILKGALEAEGIPVVLMNSTMNSIFPMLSSDVGGVSLWVPSEMADAAIIVMRRGQESRK